ncbi:MAG: hypothetical protein AAB795_03590 [Patescibacteria group bacterium]
MTKKTLLKKLKKACACCAKAIHVFLYSDRAYRGGRNIALPALASAAAGECPKCYWQG